MYNNIRRRSFVINSKEAHIYKTNFYEKVLNLIAILFIHFDNVHPTALLEKWNRLNDMTISLSLTAVAVPWLSQVSRRLQPKKTRQSRIRYTQTPPVLKMLRRLRDMSEIMIYNKETVNSDGSWQMMYINVWIRNSRASLTVRQTVIWTVVGSAGLSVVSSTGP